MIQYLTEQVYLTLTCPAGALLCFGVIAMIILMSIDNCDC